MSCADEIARLVPWYAAGTLAEEERSKVEDHLRRCPACREALSLAREAVAYGEGHTAESLTEHVQSELLTDFALHPEQLERETSDWITTHLRECATCAEQADIVRQVHADLAPDPTPVDRPRESAEPWLRRVWDFLGSTLLRPAPALGYLVLLLLSFPIYQALAPRQPSPDRPVVDASGSLEIAFLRSAARGSGDLQRVALKDRQELVYLGVEPEIPDEVPADRVYRIEILAGGREVWSHSMTASQLRSALGSDQRAVVLAVPAGALAPGAYALRVIPPAEAEPILEVSFATAR